MKKYVLVIFLAFMLLGCQAKDNISIIKKSRLTFNPRIFLGDVLDKYEYCQSKEWTEFTLEDSNKMIQFDCLIDKSKVDFLKDINFELNVIIQFAIHKEGTFNVAYCGYNATAPNGKTSTIKATGDGVRDFVKSIYDGDLPLSQEGLATLSVPLADN